MDEYLHGLSLFTLVYLRSFVEGVSSGSIPKSEGMSFARYIINAHIVDILSDYRGPLILNVDEVKTQLDSLVKLCHPLEAAPRTDLQQVIDRLDLIAFYLSRMIGEPVARPARTYVSQGGGEGLSSGGDSPRSESSSEERAADNNLNTLPLFPVSAV